MRHLPCLLFVLATACRTTATTTAAPISVGHVLVTPLGGGVYAAIRQQEPLGLAQNANSLFIVDDNGVVVVDAQFTREATLENLAALRRITTKPVRFVVNTHWHDDHLAGNQVYRDSFPGVRFVAQRNTREDLIAKGRPNRDGQVRFGPQALARFRTLLDMGLGIDSTPASALERETVNNALRIFGRYVEENPGFRETLPDSLVDRALTIVSSGRRIELRWFGRGNTRGDLVTWLPKERVVATGDLIVSPIPFTFGSYPSEWIAALDSIRALGPQVVVPGHGPLMRDLSYVDTERAMLQAAVDRAKASVARGDTSAQQFTRAERMDDMRALVAGSEKWMNTMFDQFFRAGILPRAFAEARSGASSLQ